MIVQVRPVSISDAAEINTLRRMPGVFENILGLPSERVDFNEKYLSGLGKEAHILVAVNMSEEGEYAEEADDEAEEARDGGNTLKHGMILGMAGLNIDPVLRRRHCASVGMMVRSAFQNKGVGTLLLKKLLSVADNWLMLKRIELGVFADNKRAIHLYKKFGFIAEGVKKQSVIRNGEYVDELMMARIKD